MIQLRVYIILISLLFTGVVEAKDNCIETSEKGQRVVVCDLLEADSKGSVTLEASPEKPKRVEIPYDVFLKMLAKVEHREKLLHQCAAERAILLKLKDEQGKIISIQADQVKGLIETAETQERLGATEAQINEALQKQLTKVTQDLENEKSKKYWWAGGGAISSAAIVTAIFLWVVN